MSKRRQHQHDEPSQHGGDGRESEWIAHTPETAAEAEPAAPSLSALAGLGAHEPAPTETAPDPTAPTPEPWASGGTAHDPGDGGGGGGGGDEHEQESAADAAAALADRVEAARQRGARSEWDSHHCATLPVGDTLVEIDAELSAIGEPGARVERAAKAHAAAIAERAELLAAADKAVAQAYADMVHARRDAQWRARRVELLRAERVRLVAEAARAEAARVRMLDRIARRAAVGV